MKTLHMRRRNRTQRSWNHRQSGLRLEPLEVRAMLAVDTNNDTFNINEDSVLDARASVAFALLDPNVSNTTDTNGGSPTGSVWQYLPPTLANLNQDGTGSRTPADSTWFASPLYDDTDVAHNFSSSGPSPLGYARGRNSTNNVPFIDTNIGTPAVEKNITTYFRRHVTLDAAQVAILNTAGTVLNVRMRADDGAVAYLNGYEIIRKDIPVAYSFTTLATPADAGNNGALIVTASLTAVSHPALFASFVVGDNVISGEVHQNSNSSSDVVYDVEAIASNPAAIAPILQNDTGILVGAAITVQSLPASGILRDRDGTQVTVVGQSLPGGEFTYTPAANASGTVMFDYRVDNGGVDVDTSTVTINIASVNDPPAARGDFYSAFEGDSINALATPSDPTASITAGSVWKYLDNGSNQDGLGLFDPGDGTWFASPLFSDALWASGPAELGYGDGDEQTIVSFGPDANNKFTTTYFRRTFDVAGPIPVSMYLLLKVDDGAAVYINGFEVARTNLPPGATFNTFAGDPNPGATRADDGEEWQLFLVDTASSAIVNVGNTIAVEVHQNNLTSSDVSFDLQLSQTDSRMSVLANDNDRGDTGTTLTAVLVDQTSVDAVGTLTFNPDGTFTFVPDNPISGNYTFTYKAVDDGSPLPASESGIQTVTLAFTLIDSGGITTAPDAYSVDTNDTLTVSLASDPDPGGLFAGAGVLQNDTVFVGDEFDPAVTSLVAGSLLLTPAGPGGATGTLTFNNNGTFTYTPPAGYNGTVTFEYRVNDGVADYPTSPAPGELVTITVAEISDDPPVAGNDSYRVQEDDLLDVDLPGVSAPDIVIAANSKWDYLDQMTNGGNGSPVEDYPLDGSGRVWTDSFFDIFTSDPGIGAWVSKTDVLNNGGIYGFGAIDAGPILTTVAGPASERSTYLFRNTFNVTDSHQVNELRLRGVADDGLVVYINGKERGRITMPAGPVTAGQYIPAGSEALQTVVIDIAGDLVDGTNTIAIELHQGGAGSSDLGFDMEVALLRRAGLLVNDGDEEGDPTTAITVLPGSSAEANGALSVNPDGTFTYQPNADFNGTVTFDYFITAGGVDSAPGTVTIVVESVPDVTVNSLTTNNTSPGLTGSIDDPTALVRVTVNGSTYNAVNNGAGSWGLPPGTIAPPLTDGVFEVELVALSLTSFNMGMDATTNELTIDTVAPTATVDPLTTSDQTPPLSGTISEPGTVVVTVNGNNYAANVVGLNWSLPDNTIAPPLPSGTYDVAVQVTDLAGNLGTDATLNELTVNANATIVGRRIFYNNSAFDGNNASANVADDGAIAPDKTALLPGGTATFANYTSFSKGINGIMIDFAGPHGVLSLADFSFFVGNNNSVGSWAVAPAPTSMTIRAVGPVDRVTFIWPDNPAVNSVRKQWLRVVTAATVNTNLASADVFYFGNAVGESGDTTTNAAVNATDEIGARANPRSALVNPAPIDFRWDYNRDRAVNSTDQLIARTNTTTLANRLVLIAPPSGGGGGGGGALADAALDDGGDLVDILARSRKRR